MKFMLLLALFATVLFIPAWWVQYPWQHALITVAWKMVEPPGSPIEPADMELYFPFDISVYVALCLASLWIPWRRRLRAIAIGFPVMVLLELISVALAFAAILSVAMDRRATATMAEEVLRFATGVIRVTGLIAAAVVWYFQLGRERLSLAARAWLGTGEQTRRS